MIRVWAMGIFLLVLMLAVILLNMLFAYKESFYLTVFLMPLVYAILFCVFRLILEIPPKPDYASNMGIHIVGAMFRSFQETNEHLIDDLDEEYAQRLEIDGLREANRWLRQQLICSIVPLLLGSLQALIKEFKSA